MKLLDDLDKLEKAATPGPWFYVEQSHGGFGLKRDENRVYAVDICGDGRGPDCRPWFEGCGFKRWSSRVIAQIKDWAEWTDHPANRDLIIALRNAYPELRDTIRRQEEELIKLHEVFQDFKLWMEDRITNGPVETKGHGDNSGHPHFWAAIQVPDWEMKQKRELLLMALEAK